MQSLVDIGPLVPGKKMKMWKVYDNNDNDDNSDNDDDGQRTKFVQKLGEREREGGLWDNMYRGQEKICPVTYVLIFYKIKLKYLNIWVW